MGREGNEIYNTLHIGKKIKRIETTVVPASAMAVGQLAGWRPLLKLK